jgi:hypothetical protein
VGGGVGWGGGAFIVGRDPGSLCIGDGTDANYHRMIPAAASPDKDGSSLSRVDRLLRQSPPAVLDRPAHMTWST